jgi:hypothetical protein
MKAMLDEIKKEVKQQQRGIQGCNANPSRFLKENQLTWLISRAEKAERYEEALNQITDNPSDKMDCICVDIAFKALNAK